MKELSKIYQNHSRYLNHLKIISELFRFLKKTSRFISQGNLGYDIICIRCAINFSEDDIICFL